MGAADHSALAVCRVHSKLAEETEERQRQKTHSRDDRPTREDPIIGFGGGREGGKDEKTTREGKGEEGPKPLDEHRQSPPSPAAVGTAGSGERWRSECEDSRGQWRWSTVDSDDVVEEGQVEWSQVTGATDAHWSSTC